MFVKSKNKLSTSLNVKTIALILHGSSIEDIVGLQPYMLYLKKGVERNIFKYFAKLIKNLIITRKSNAKHLV